MGTAALEERIAKLDIDHDLIILGNIQIEKRVSAMEKDAPPTSARNEVGDDEDQAPFNAAQLHALSWDINHCHEDPGPCD